MKLRCIIVDDEPVARKIIRQFADQVEILNILDEFRSALKADAFLQNHDVDLIFLDIEMPKLSGIDFLNTMSKKPLVILTTAYPEYALEGYKYDVIDYLLKPIAFERFYKAIQKAKEYFELRETNIHGGNSSPYLFVKTDKKIEKVIINDILFIESLGNYVSICTEAKKMLSYLTLKSMEKQLPASEFMKIHQSFIVQLSKIDCIEGNEINIKNKKLPISRSYKDSVMKAVEQRLLKKI